MEEHPESDIVASIRRRPGMYMGDPWDGSGLLEMIWEVVANSIDEHFVGTCGRIAVVIDADGSVVVDDDGRGIRIDEVEGTPFAEIALTRLHAAPTLDGHAPHEHLRPVGVGLVAVNALSSDLTLEVFAAGRHHCQRYERGRRRTGIDDVGPTERTGTRITFVPDPEIFHQTWIDPGPIAQRLRELACLVPTLTFEFLDRRQHRFHEPDGLRVLLERTSWRRDASEPLVVHERVGAIEVDAVVRWGPSGAAVLESYASFHRTTGGGTHEDGLLEGLADALVEFALRAGERPTRARARATVRDELDAIVRVRLRDPTYGSPTKDRLSTPEARDAVREAVHRAFAERLSSGEPALASRMLRALVTPRER